MYSFKKIKALKRKETFNFKAEKIYGKFENKKIPVKNNFEHILKFCLACVMKQENEKSNKFSYIIEDENNNIIFELSSERKFISKIHKKEMRNFLKYLKFLKYNFKEKDILNRYSYNPYLYETSKGEI